MAVFGSSEPEVSQNFGFKTHYLGHLYDDVSLVTLYSAVDVMIVPSLQENLSNAIMESLSCATPVVAFDVGGNSDMIEHKINGYLARPFDTDDLVYGIEWVLNYENYDELCKNAREKVLKEFDFSTNKERVYTETEKKSVVHQLENLLTFPEVKKRLKENTLDVHAWHYKIEDGTIECYNTQTKKFEDLC